MRAAIVGVCFEDFDIFVVQTVGSRTGGETNILETSINVILLSVFLQVQAPGWRLGDVNVRFCPCGKYVLVAGVGLEA